MSLAGKTVLITGAARRIGRALALGVASAGGQVVIHYGHSAGEAEALQRELAGQGVRCWRVQADLEDSDSVQSMLASLPAEVELFALVNNAAIFEPAAWATTDLATWNRHLAINLTAPFFLSQAFARRLPATNQGRIVNLLDWRALRPGPDHLPYTISKAALAALTRSLAQALAPRITVNGLALGAILPPADGATNARLLEPVPAGRWAQLDEVVQTLLFLLDGPPYITGEVIHVDGGRHLT